MSWLKLPAELPKPERAIPSPRKSPKYCNIPREYKFWIQELCENYLNGYRGKVVKHGKTARAITRTQQLLEVVK